MMLQLADELRTRGHHILPILPADGDQWLATQFRASAFDVAPFSQRRGLDPLTLAQVVRLISRHRIDVVHSHAFTASVYGGAAAWLLRKPHVITMHGSKYYLERRRRRVALRWSARHSRAVVGVSSETASQLASGLGLPPEAVRVVYNGVPHASGDRSRGRRELGLGTDDLLVVAVGSLFPVKGHVVLVRALAELQQTGDVAPWHAVIAGTGGEERALRVAIDEHGLSTRVRLLGFRSDVPDLLAAADVYAMPSLYEGSPLALMEAMFAQNAIVASAIGGIPELVTHEREALLVPPGEPTALAAALRRLFSSRELRERLGSAAFRRAKDNFTIARMADEYERLYASA
jgi:glycosyltransferase involved in cell wall biosynthesis